MPEETKRIAVGTQIIDVLIKSICGPGEFAPGYEKIVLPRGFQGIKAEAEKNMRKFSPDREEERARYDYLKAMAICYEGMSILCRRYAFQAKELAEKEENRQRKAELEQICMVCEWLAANPPRTFHEALQLLWFVQVGLYIEANAPSYSPGRFDQYMYPYLKQDLASGRLTKEQAQELLDCLWIKLSENTWLHSKDSAKFFAGYMPFQNLSVGGMTVDGKDGTNDLSLMCIQASINTRLYQPSLSARFHEGTPQHFKQKAAELISLGGGFPACHNDHTTIQMLLNKGVSLEDARDYAMVGCVEPNSAGGTMAQWSDGGHYNFGSAMEFALSNGYHHLSSKHLGIKTGDPLTFTGYEQLFDAVKQQIAYCIKHDAIANWVMEEAHEKMLPLPFGSATVADCIAQGEDMITGGARYNAGPALIGTGIADISNSLAAVKKLVFEEKRLSMQELLEAINTNFENYEPLRIMLLNEAPKYGNDDDYVDGIASEIADFVAGEVEKYSSRKGCKLISGLYPVSSHVPHGMVVWALPSGRKAEMPLADGCSPSQGTDVKGPTAVIKSVSKLDHTRHTAGTLFNMKFSPAALKGESGMSNLIALIDTYFELGGYHIQFNVVSSQALKEAQQKPAEHSSLMVRVAGYSAYFVELCKEIQDDIIARTEHADI